MDNSDLVMSICRGCLAADRKMASATLYEAEFKDLTGITISPSDMLPQWLCYECIALLQKCVRFRNKVMRSHYTLCTYVLEDVPLVCDKGNNPHLSRSTILHYEVPGSQTVQPEDSIENSAVSDIVITEMESVKVKDEIVSDIFTDNIIIGEICEQNYHDIMDVARASSPCYLSELDTNKIRLVTSNHEKQTEEREVIEQMSPGVVDTDLKTVELIAETSSLDDDDITIEERSIDQPNELKSKSSTRKPEQEEQGQEQTASELVRTGTHAAREHLHEHIDMSSTLRKEYDGKNVQRNVICDDSLNGNSCSNVMLYICDECNKYFNNKSLLISHIRRHSKQKPNQKLYKCRECMKCFSRQGSHNRDTQVHTSDKPYKYVVCVCMKCFTDKYQYDVQTRLQKDQKPYKCEVCMKCFAKKSYYNLHMRIHKGIKPYKCDVCMKSFSDSSNYKEHMRIHTGEKPYKCEVCMKRFAQNSSYKVHMRIHNGEKPYICNVCMKCFTQNSSYNVHMRIHRSEKPYKCNVCMKCFTRKGDYNRHLRIHTDEKPYKCDVCTKMFTALSTYNAHMRIHKE